MLLASTRIKKIHFSLCYWFFFLTSLWPDLSSNGGLSFTLCMTLISFFNFNKTPRPLIPGIKESQRKRKGEEEKTWLMWNRKEFDRKRYKSFLFPMLQIRTNRRLKIFCAICLKSQFILGFFFLNTTNLNTFYYLPGSKESINISSSLLGPPSCLPKAMKIKSKAASMGRGL